MKKSNFIYIFLIVFFTIHLLSCNEEPVEKETLIDTVYLNQETLFIDPRDEQAYQIVEIGDQIWFAENLKIEIKDSSTCYYNDDLNCFIYGRLYNGFAAQNACPPGWNLPSVEDWEALFDYLGGMKVAGLLLQPFGKFGNQLVGFNVLPGGRYLGGKYQNLGQTAYYFTSTPAGYPDSYYVYSIAKDGTIDEFGTSANVYFSCRCIKDPSNEE